MYYASETYACSLRGTRGYVGDLEEESQFDTAWLQLRRGLSVSFIAVLGRCVAGENEDTQIIAHHFDPQLYKLVLMYFVETRPGSCEHLLGIHTYNTNADTAPKSQPSDMSYLSFDFFY
jgi:hypothetical protein